VGGLLNYGLAGLAMGLLSSSLGAIFQIGKFPVDGIIGGLFMVALGIYIGGWL